MNSFTKNIRGFVDFGKQAEPKNPCLLPVMTYELPRQETNHSVTTHAPTQVITGQQKFGSKLTNLRQLLVMTAEAGNQPLGYDPHTYTSHHKKQLIGSKLTNFKQLLVMTCELPRQETDPTVMTHTPTQVTTGSS